MKVIKKEKMHIILYKGICDDYVKKIVIGLLAGIISGFFSSGGGLILVPAFVHILKMDDKMARATSVFCIMPMVIATAFFITKIIFSMGYRNKMCNRWNSRWNNWFKIINKNTRQIFKNCFCIIFNICSNYYNNKIKEGI